MPEALAVVAVAVVAVVAWFGAWLQARNPANFNPRDEVERLQHHAVWLEQRIVVAQQEKWGADMIETLMEERNLTVRTLARTAGRSSQR